MNANLMLHFSMNYLLKYNLKCTHKIYEILMCSPWYSYQISFLLDLPSLEDWYSAGHLTSQI